MIDVATHRIYEAVIGSNIGQSLTNIEKWVYIGPTNRYAAFDLLRNTATVQGSPIVMIIKPGIRFDSLGLAGLQANAASTTIYSSSAVAYQRKLNLNSRETTRWYEYYFGRFSTRKTSALFDLPPYSDAIIAAVLSATSGDTECGACGIGTFEDIGKVQYEAESEALNFSDVSQEDGVLVMTPSLMPRRRSSKFTSKRNTQIAFGLCATTLNGGVAFWSALDDSTDEYFEAMFIVGPYTRFTINLKYPQHGIISLELKDLQ